ncbi:hypothetical protein HY380_02475 [Candidatus Saccharibacteria bacterium]|nr:hypothetical protein [Candidatus Saccharibacteria bacterium]
MSRPQLNLLPDIKLTYIKQQRTRNLITTSAILISAVCLLVFLIMLVTVYGLQKKQLSNSDKSIASSTAELQQITGLNDILTVQNQLTTLSSLHKQKHHAGRIFNYLTKLTPADISVSNVSIDFKGAAMGISGTAGSAHSVNVFIDTLKFTTYRLAGQSGRPAFPSVVESSFGLSALGVNFSLNIKFDPMLFSSAAVNSNGQVAVPRLSVPSKNTTRSQLKNPTSNLFSGQSSGGQQ